MDSVEIGRHIDLDLIQHLINLNRLTAQNGTRDNTLGRIHLPCDSEIVNLNNNKNEPIAKINGKKSKLHAKRCLTSAYNNQRPHWWKVCWIYNGSLLFDSLSSKYSSAQLQNGYPLSKLSSANTCSTLPRDLKLSSDGQETDLHMSKKSDGNKMVSSSHDQHRSPLVLPSHLHQSTLPVSSHRLSESKSMTTLEAKPNIFSFPNQLRFVEKKLPKEVTRFCSQQLGPGNFLPSKITQPLAIWTKSKSGVLQTNIVNFLNQYKGTDWRHKQLQYQMPIHDIELFRQPTAESKFIRSKQRKALVKSELFLTQQSNEICSKCKQLIQNGVHAVKISLFDHNPENVSIKLSKNISASNQNNPHIKYHNYYHIDCFTCFDCDQILVDLKAFIHVSNDKDNVVNYNLFCCRHFVEIYKPRCPYCDKLIFDEECTEAEGKAWHIGHFCCTECKRSLGGQQYIMTSVDNMNDNTIGVNLKLKAKQIPYCLTCFDIMFGELCEECGELIGCEVGAIMHEGRSWHASESCFRCSLCLKSLLGKPFLPAMDGRIYCSLTCSQAMISHQKERLRRQNKLQTLHCNKISLIKAEKSTIVNDNSNQLSLNVNQHNKSLSNINNNVAIKAIKENRDNFMKSMTLGRYEKQAKYNRNLANNNSDYQKLKSLNLTQIVNYEEFIKQNNQCFTSKYDWSKEQEFLNVIDSSNEILSQSTVSDQNSDDNNLMQQFLIKCDISAIDFTNKQSSQNTLLYNPTIQPLQNGYKEFRADFQTSSKKDKSILNSLVAEQSSSQSAVNNYYFEDKPSSLNSPSSSNETPLLAISPPPEYSKIENDFKDESSSSISSIQNSCPKNTSKTNGILKVSVKQFSGIKQVLESSPNPSTESNNSTPLATNFESINSINYQPLYNPFKSMSQNTSINNEQMNETTSKSNIKSVSFDPNIEDRNENKLRSIRKVRSAEMNHEDCDSHSCSSCSTCSSSSSDDDDDDDFAYNLVNFNLNNQSEGSRSTSLDQPNNNHRRTLANNEACLIS